MLVDHDDDSSGGGPAGVTEPGSGASEPVSPQPWIPPLRYRAHPMVRWFAPAEVLRGAYGEFFGRLFGRYADSRETQAALREPVVHHAQGPVLGARLGSIDPENFLIFCNDQLPFQRLVQRPSELTVDYVADVGDGFSSTFTIARQLAEPVTTVAIDDDTDLALGRGSLIMMGGDEVYPAAGAEHYRDRTIGPYRTAFPPESATGPDGSDRRVPLFAIPGNHDWYDGLAAFLERFTVYQSGDDMSRRRGWSLHQTRSYHAIQLTDTWWLWGIDIALNADIDTPQMQYFRQVAAMMPAECRIILCTGKPAWFRRGERGWFDRWLGSMRERFGRIEPEASDEWNRLTYFLEKTLGSAAPDAVRLVLTGDKHFYARHEPVDDPTKPTVVVSGGGGAYLASTLEAPRRLHLPWRFSSTETTDYEAKHEWPDRGTSRRTGLTALWRIPWGNPELGTVFGVIYTLFGLAARAGAQRAFDSTDQPSEPVEVLEPFTAGPFWQDQLQILWAAMHNIGAWVITGLMLLALFAMAKAHRRSWYVAGPAAGFHLALHGVAATAAIAGAARLTETVPGLDSPLARVFWADSLIASWPTASFTVITGLIGAGFGLVAFALYLVVAQYFGINLNELFVGMRLAGHKHFLRLRIADDRVVGHVIGFDEIGDLDLRWDDGRPVVDGDQPEPTLVDIFTVSAHPTSSGAGPAIDQRSA